MQKRTETEMATGTGMRIVAPKALAKWLGVLFATYGGARLTEDVITGYTIALADLTEQDLKLAFEESMRMSRSSFPPKPGEIRGYLEAARERMRPAGSCANSDCRECLGTGWRVVNREGNNFAVRCECIRGWDR